MTPYRHVSAGAVLLAIICAALPGFAGETKIAFIADTVLIADVDIPQGVTCTIKPGITIQFDGYVTFTVHGLLIAEGTKAKPIVFSSVKRPETLREDPGWKGIEIIGKQANARFKHCRISDAYRNFIWEAGPSFDSCEFTGNHFGLYCSKKASPLISNCSFSHNAYGIAIDYSYPLLLNNSITGNVIGLYLQLTAETIAGKNLITGNRTNISAEKAYSNDSAAFNLQSLWNVMQQLY
jgi:parallel beta-helix repeat protein